MTDATPPSSNLAPIAVVPETSRKDPNASPAVPKTSDIQEDTTMQDSPALNKAPAVPEVEAIDYDGIAERVTTDPVTFYKTMLEPDFTELFLQCKEFVRITTEETDARVDLNRVRDGTASLTDFIQVGTAQKGTDNFVDGETFRQELRKCIYATAAWQDGFPGAKVDDKFAEYKKKMKKEAIAKKKKADAAAARKQKAEARNKNNWNKQKKPVLVEECERRGFATKGLKVDDLKKLLFADDQKIADEEAAKEKEAAEEEKATLEAMKNNDAMDLDEVIE